LAGFFYEHDFGSQLFEPFAMRVEITLKGEDPDFHKCFQLSALNSQLSAISFQ
jgi:hypothetical protein